MRNAGSQQISCFHCVGEGRLGGVPQGGLLFLALSGIILFRQL